MAAIFKGERRVNYYIFAALSIVFALLNGFFAKRRGYYFWRAFFFGIILCIVIGAILLKAFGN